MNGIIDFANTYVKKFMDYITPAVLMMLVLTIVAIAVGVKFSKALEAVLD